MINSMLDNGILGVLDASNMTTDELEALREQLFDAVEHRRKLGDYDANAPGVRQALEACLQLTQHLLDRLKR